jgi:hypothetical protein
VVSQNARAAYKMILNEFLIFYQSKQYFCSQLLSGDVPRICKIKMVYAKEVLTYRELSLNLELDH